MKPSLLSCLVLLLAGTAARAQLSLLPQAGFEQSRTALGYGNGLSASSINTNVKAGLKTAYGLKGGHTPFLNLTTAPAPVIFSFNSNGDLTDHFQSTIPKLRLEAGYQFSSKAIQLGKKGTANNAASSATEQAAAPQSRCGLLYRSHCGQQKRMSRMNPVNEPWTMRLQPALALAYVPSAEQSLRSKSNGLEYKAAAWKTALVPSVGVEFAKGQQRLFTVSIFYTKPLAEGDQMATLSSGVKAVPVMLQPKTASWGLTVGVPFSFARTGHHKPTMEKKECRRNSYRRCMRVQ